MSAEPQAYMTIKDLRQELKNLPDKLTVLVEGTELGRAILARRQRLEPEPNRSLGLEPNVYRQTGKDAPDKQVRVVDWAYDLNGNKIEPGRPGRILQAKSHVMGGALYHIVEFRPRVEQHVAGQTGQYALVADHNLRPKEGYQAGDYVLLTHGTRGADGTWLAARWVGEVLRYKERYDAYLIRFTIDYVRAVSDRPYAKRHVSVALLGEQLLAPVDKSKEWSVVNQSENRMFDC